jgi:DNA-binding transcriptional ArsR family regulator
VNTPPPQQQLDRLFGALSDPTRRHVLETLLEAGSTSVPRLAAELPISRQAVAKHLATLSDAGLVERVSGPGREVAYRLAPGALRPAASWIQEADRAWGERLERLRRSVEGPEQRAPQPGGGAARPDGVGT